MMIKYDLKLKHFKQKEDFELDNPEAEIKRYLLDAKALYFLMDHNLILGPSWYRKTNWNETIIRKSLNKQEIHTQTTSDLKCMDQSDIVAVRSVLLSKIHEISQGDRSWVYYLDKDCNNHSHTRKSCWKMNDSSCCLKRKFQERDCQRRRSGTSHCEPWDYDLKQSESSSEDDWDIYIMFTVWLSTVLKTNSTVSFV